MSSFNDLLAEWDEEWDGEYSLGEVVKQDQDFEPIIETVPATYRKTQSSVTNLTPKDLNVATCLNNFSEDEIKVLIKPEVLTSQIICKMDEPGEYNVGGIIYDKRLDVLDHCFKIDESIMKNNLKKFGFEILDCLDMKPNDYLRFSRYLRKTKPLLNRATKICLANSPLTTYHKFDFDKITGVEPVTLFGFAHDKHHGFRSFENILCSYDTEATPKGKVKYGNILDWENLVETDWVVSDVAVGRKNEMGFFSSDKLWDVYKQMYDKGKKLIYKAHIDDPPVGKVIAWRKQRNHNHEIILYVDKNAKEPVEVPDFKEDLFLNNAIRNDMIMENNLPRYVGEKFPPFCVLKRTLECWPGHTGKKIENRFAALHFGKKMGYLDLCYDNNLNNDFKLLAQAIPVEPPFAFSDLPVFDPDPINFFYGVIKFLDDNAIPYGYDEDVGWYAE